MVNSLNKGPFWVLTIRTPHMQSTKKRPHLLEQPLHDSGLGSRPGVCVSADCEMLFSNSMSHNATRGPMRSSSRV